MRPPCPPILHYPEAPSRLALEMLRLRLEAQTHKHARVLYLTYPHAESSHTSHGAPRPGFRPMRLVADDRGLLDIASVSGGGWRPTEESAAEACRHDWEVYIEPVFSGRPLTPPLRGVHKVPV